MDLVQNECVYLQVSVKKLTKHLTPLIIINFNARPLEKQLRHFCPFTVEAAVNGYLYLMKADELTIVDSPTTN